jgi:hypothetical protein
MSLGREVLFARLKKRIERKFYGISAFLDIFFNIFEENEHQLPYIILYCI